MIRNKKKIAFIICTNDSLYFEECKAYIGRLVVPEGYEIEILAVEEAQSMTAGYNEGRLASDAEYKIYLHQDVFIIYPLFLESILEIFASNDKIGMIGMVGSEEISPSGVMWTGYRIGNLYSSATKLSDNLTYKNYKYRLEDGLTMVEAVDGLMMITSKEVPWREDLFDGWDFYDVSQSFEMIRAGYKVVVPGQKIPWCLHDDGLLNFRSYDKYRRICLNEYKEFFGEKANEHNGNNG